MFGIPIVLIALAAAPVGIIAIVIYPLWKELRKTRLIEKYSDDMLKPKPITNEEYDRICRPDVF
jgi:hypothetical protein